MELNFLFLLPVFLLTLILSAVKKTCNNGGNSFTPVSPAIFAFCALSSLLGLTTLLFSFKGLESLVALSSNSLSTLSALFTLLKKA